MAQGSLKTEINPLTGLRGIAAVIVMIYHFGHPYNARCVNTHFSFRQGYMAVDCFYILSGFVLAYSYGEWFRGRFELARFGGFMLRRVARLYPAYLVIAVVTFLKSVINVSGNGALTHYKTFDYVMNFLMFTGIGLKIYPLIPDSWSVSAEMVAYALFPILVFFGVFCRPLLGLLFLGGAAGSLVFVAHSGLGSQGPLDVVHGGVSILRCVAGFSVGLVLFRLTKLTSMLSVLASDALCGLAVLAIIIGWLLHAPDLMLFPYLAVLVFALSFNGAIANRLFGNRPVYHLGEISYSLYLIHPAFISVAISLTLIVQRRLDIHWAYPIFAVAGWILSLKLAQFSTRWIEKPGRRLVMSAVSPLFSRKEAQMYLSRPVLPPVSGPPAAQNLQGEA